MRFDNAAPATVLNTFIVILGAFLLCQNICLDTDRRGPSPIIIKSQCLHVKLGSELG